MLDSLTVPRRAYDFEDYVDILRRNFLWIIAPAFLGLVASVVYAYSLGDVYVSTALLRVTPQQISADLVKSITSQDVADKINTMAQDILSRSTLTAIINNYGLYKDLIKKEPLEDVIQGMKTSISITPVGGTSVGSKVLPLMQVGFVYGDKYVAQKVCADLVSRFVNFTTQSSSQSQQAAGQFLSDESVQAKKALDDAEQKLEDFQAKNAGRLPEEMQLNMQEMNALEGQLGSLNDAARRNDEQRMMLSSQLNTAKQELALIRNPVSVQQSRVQVLDGQIAALQASIAEMEQRFTDDYPDVQTAKDRLTKLIKQRDDAAKEKQPRADLQVIDDPQVDQARTAAQGNIDALNTQLKANALDAADLRAGIRSVNAQLNAYQQKMREGPASSKEYSDLVQARDLARATYIGAAQKQEVSTASQHLEERGQGETLEIIDQASLPQTPALPNRKKLIPIGPAIGLFAGIAMVVIREVKDTSLKSLKDARLYTQLSILGSIPLLENDVVVQRRKQVMWVGWATATIAGLAVMGFSLAHYWMNRG